MRTIKYLALLTAATVVFSLGAFAKDFQSGKFDLTQPARVGTTTLQPGHYRAEWNGPDNALNVAIISHGKTVATAHGHLKEMPNKSPYTAVTLKNRGNHTQQVDEIDFDHQSEALVLAGA